MQVKEMREFLTDKVDTVPRKNEDVITMYNEKCADDVPRETTKVAADGEEWTYVGFGDTPPHMVNFMGMQVFVRGQPVMVTDERVLAKIDNRCFVRGKANMEEAYASDELAAKRVQKQREEDVKTQIIVDRANRKG